MDSNRNYSVSRRARAQACQTTDWLYLGRVRDHKRRERKYFNSVETQTQSVF